MKARLGCRGVLETRFPRMWLSLTSDKMKVEATTEKESESTLFYLIPTGMREVCIQSVMNDQNQFDYCDVGDVILTVQVGSLG